MKESMIYEKLKAYTESDWYPFHMPGHKRQTYPFDESYSIDITEIEGFDDYHHPEGIIGDAMRRGAKVYGADATYYLVNGSTGGILSAVSAATDLGDSILVARNCHKSVYNTVFLRNLTPYYVYPQKTGELGIVGGILPGDVENMLIRHPKIRAAVIVSPTYEGILSDVEGIARVCHRHGIPLIVDEAHGAHLPFWSAGPKSALECGADCVIQSLHKTLPSLTQTGIIHWKKGYMEQRRLEQYLHMYQSSSPSYIFLAAMEKCVAMMEGQGREQMRLHGERMKQWIRRCASFQAIRVLDFSVCSSPGVYAWDWTRLVIMTRGHRGGELHRRLREEYHLQMEMETPDYVVAITTLADTDEGLERLYRALQAIDEAWGREKKNCDGSSKSREVSACPPAGGQWGGPQAISPYEASLLPRKQVPWNEAKGEISAETAYIYPPGIPFLMPGEVISEGHLETLAFYKEEGFQIHGMMDPSMKQLQVIEGLKRKDG